MVNKKLHLRWCIVKHSQMSLFDKLRGPLCGEDVTNYLPVYECSFLFTIPVRWLFLLIETGASAVITAWWREGLRRYEQEDDRLQKYYVCEAFEGQRKEPRIACHLTYIKARTNVFVNTMHMSGLPRCSNPTQRCQGLSIPKRHSICLIFRYVIPGLQA